MLISVALVKTDDSEELFLRSVLRLLVTANFIPSWPFLVTLIMWAISSSQTSVLTTATWRDITEEGILHSHRLENLKFYIALTGWALWQRSDVLPVKYELGFYIPDDVIPHYHRPENLKAYGVWNGIRIY
jgi:hypothetical protein